MKTLVICVRRQLLVLTGAGVSTESAVPDYRGPQGAYRTGFKPMTHQQVTALYFYLDNLASISLRDFVAGAVQ